MTDIPHEFICPITLEIMIDPVLCEDGITYERKAIMSIRNSLSPMTRQPIDKTKLLPNRALKECIQRYNESNKKEYNEPIRKCFLEKEKIEGKRISNTVAGMLQRSLLKKGIIEKEKIDEKRVPNNTIGRIIKSYEKERKVIQYPYNLHKLEKQQTISNDEINQSLISKYNEKNPSFKWGKRYNFACNGNCNYDFYPAVNKGMHKFIFDIKMIELIKNKDNNYLINYKKIKEDYKWIMKYNYDDKSYINFVFDEIIPNIDTIIQEIKDKLIYLEKYLENSIKDYSGMPCAQAQIVPNRERVMYITQILSEYIGLKSQIPDLKSRVYYFENLDKDPFSGRGNLSFILNTDFHLCRTTSTSDFKYHSIYLTWIKKKINIMDSLISSINMIMLNEGNCTFRLPSMNGNSDIHENVDILNSYKEYVFTETHEKFFDAREGWKQNFMTYDYSFKFFEPIILLSKNIIDLTEEVK